MRGSQFCNNMYSKSILEIDLDTIKKNYLKLRELSIAEVGGSVKANCYGLGATQISKMLKNEGMRKFFVATLTEALELRNELNDVEILVFSGVFPGEEREFVNNKIMPVINNLWQIELLNNFANKLEIKYPVMIHVETGLHRLSMPVSELDQILLRPELTSNLEIKYIMSHLASSEDETSEMNKIQLKRFNEILFRFKSLGYKNIKASLANSGGIMLGKDYHFDIVRSGAALYGINGPKNSQAAKIGAEMSPEMRFFGNPVRLFSPLIHFKEVQKGESLGYNSTYILKTNRIIGTIVAGYADGIFRFLSNRGYCYIKGIKVPIVGRVSMDLLNIDITDLPENLVYIGQEVDIISNYQTPDDLAEHAGTIGYEIITSLGNRYERIYKSK